MTNRSLDERRRLLEQKVLPKLTEPVRYAAPLDAALPVLIESVKSQGLEGLVAKRSTVDTNQVCVRAPG